jgi:cytidylate kinase
MERDRRDAGRAIAPMTPAADSITLDTTSMSFDDVVRALERIVRHAKKGHV